MTPKIIVSNVIPGEGRTRCFADVRVELAPDLVLVIRDVRLYGSRQGGHSVRFPRRFRDESYYDVVGFERGDAGAMISAIRKALVAQLATPAELAADAQEWWR